MTILYFTLLVLAGAYLAGLIGSLTGLGGGVVIIPLLTLAFHVDIRYAIGAALLASIANSSGAASAYVREGITNIRLGMFLEIATTTGAIAGAFLAVYTPVNTIAILFGVVLLFSSVMTLKKKNERALTAGSPASVRLRLNSSYPTPEGPVGYQLKNVGLGFGLMWIAGIFSGLLGIGSGALKVLAMDSAMRIPFKVSATTSNFMIGVTATASAVVYFQRGYMSAGISFPVVLGVLGGAFTGSKLLTKLDVRVLRYIFSAAIVFVALEMMFNGFNHKF
ncbi:MAG: sulfite exporter TauE/SafE family protein [Bacteroidetes bacterium]|nr:sulfite exporter TauE/SafE family protein [Bacteroidota bacterium]